MFTYKKYYSSVNILPVWQEFQLIAHVFHENTSGDIIFGTPIVIPTLDDSVTFTKPQRKVYDLSVW